MNNLFNLSTGFEFEDEAITVISEVAILKYGVKSFKRASKRQDIFEGTDMELLGIPMDITLNFSGKDNMIISEKVIELYSGEKIRFGVRTGNRRVKFETPVLVIGFDLLHVSKKNFIDAIDRIKHCFVDMLEIGMDEYAEIAWAEGEE